jgi:regulator of protease activity HflC (stomatin/prohibitin superfamily)
MTTGDNIALNIVANVNWRVKDPQIAASRNVDTAVANADALIKPIQDDVILQVTSALAALVGSIQYGSQGTSGIQASGATGKIDDDEKTGRKALWDAQRLANAVTSANEMTERYGVLIVSINLISAAPRDEKLVEIMSRGAVASVSAEEKLKEARAAANALLVQANAEKETSQANADAMLIMARADAEAQTVAAAADADAEQIRATGARDAGLLMGESQVATALAKLKVAYSPFVDNKSSTFFFGLHGPGDLPTALLGNSLAAQTGVAGLDFGPGAQGGPAPGAGGGQGWFR